MIIARQSTVSVRGPKMSEDQNNRTLCFWLGFFLSLFGVLIAAIIGKGKGVIRAFQGMLLSLVIVLLLFICVTCFGVLGVAREEKKNEQIRIEQQLLKEKESTERAEQVTRNAELQRKESISRLARVEKQQKRIAELGGEKRSLIDEYQATKRIADGLTGLRLDDPKRIEAAKNAEIILKKGRVLTEELISLQSDSGK